MNLTGSLINCQTAYSDSSSVFQTFLIPQSHVLSYSECLLNTMLGVLDIVGSEGREDKKKRNNIKGRLAKIYAN